MRLGGLEHQDGGHAENDEVVGSVDRRGEQRRGHARPGQAEHRGVVLQGGLEIDGAEQHPGQQGQQEGEADPNRPGNASYRLRFPRQRSSASHRPWYAPQTGKFHFAPCQSPPSIITTARFK
jgi:hypothetical protein